MWVQNVIDRTLILRLVRFLNQCSSGHHQFNQRSLISPKLQNDFLIQIQSLVQESGNIETLQPPSQQLKQLSKSSSHLKVTNMVPEKKAQIIYDLAKPTFCFCSSD